MTDQRYEKLTLKQRDCLRLVARGHQEKEIARILSTTPGAIKERLRAARETIGSNSSRDAARLFADWEADAYTIAAASYTRGVEDAQTLADGSVSWARTASSAAEPEQSGAGMVMEEAARIEAMPSRSRRTTPWPWPSEERQCSELTGSERIIASLALSGAFLLSAAIIILAVLLLMSFLRQMALHGG